jgi:hypothetical protein
MAVRLKRKLAVTLCAFAGNILGFKEAAWATWIDDRERIAWGNNVVGPRSALEIVPLLDLVALGDNGPSPAEYGLAGQRRPGW